MTQPGTREVVLADIPVRTFWQFQRHQDEMLREFALIAIDQDRGGAQNVPARLVELVHDLRRRYTGPRGELIDALEEAARRGDEQVTVTVRLPLAAAEIVQATCAAYEEADRYCREGDLLTLAAPAEVADLRRRLCAEIVRQLAS